MAKTFKKGDKVEWNASGGKTTGKVGLTEPTDVEGGRVAASDDPEHLAKSDKSGERAAHKPELTRKG